MAVLHRMPVALLVVATLCSCRSAPNPSEPAIPLAAHLISSDGAPVSGAPEPEAVQLKKIETINTEKHITIGNVAGDYVLACDEEANKEETGIHSCLSPRAQQNYLLFREPTKWLIKGAEEPINLKFMQNFSVKYNHGENVGLMPARKSDAEQFGVYWLLSWTERKTAPH